MKLLFVLLLLLALTSCMTKKTYYKNGQMKSERSGWVDWSDGKNISVPISGVGV